MVKLGMVTTGKPGSTVAPIFRAQREAMRPIVEKSGFKVTQ